MQKKLQKLKSIGYFMLVGGCISLVVACGSEPESQPEDDRMEEIGPMEPMLDTMKMDTTDMDTSASQRPRVRT